MLELAETPTTTILQGERELIDLVWDDVLTIIRDKEKEVLELGERIANTQLKFPSGLTKYVCRELDAWKIDYEIQVTPEKLPRVEVKNTLLSDGPEPITLRDYQVTSIKKCLSRYRGVISLPTGSGKTSIIISLAKLLGNSLTVVPSTASMEQTYSRFLKRGVNDVGKFGGGFEELDKSNLVATASILNSRLNAIQNRLDKVELLMFDEVHHLGTAPSWQAVAKACPASRRFGFSGSPWASGMPYIDLHNDKESKYADFRVTAYVGETLVYIPSKMLRDMGVIVDPKIYVLPIFEPKGLKKNPYPRWSWVYKRGIITNEDRNHKIVEATHRLCEKGHRVATLVVSIPHGKDLLKQLYDKGLNVAFTKGNDEVLVYDGKKIRTKKKSGGQYREAFLAGEVDTLIGSVIIDEAIDLPGMSVLILAGGQKSPIRAVQRVGRAIRTADGKDEAIIIDFRDKQHYWLNNHTYQRLRIYGAHEYDYQEVEWEELWELI